MEPAIQTMVKIFLKSSKGKENLGKKEFQGLVKNQLSNILSDTDSKEAVNNMGQGLDANQDGKVGFEEYMKLVGYIAVSLSEQRELAKEQPAQNTASGQVVQSAPDKEEEKPEAKEEAKPEANEEAKKAEATAEVQVEAKAEGETAKKEEKPAAAAVAVVEVAPAAPAAVGVETEKVEEAVEKIAAAVKEEVKKKNEEETS